MTSRSVVPLRLNLIFSLMLVAVVPLDAQSSPNCRQILSHPAGGGGMRGCAAAVSEAGTFPIFGPVIYTGGHQSEGPSTEVFTLDRASAVYGLRIINLGSARATV